MQITHEVPSPWREHLKLLQGKIVADQQRALMLRGEVALLDSQRDENSRAAGNIVALLVKEAELPNPIRPYQLSPDGTQIVGETPDPKETENANQTT
jgi:hypothetical protein